MKDMEYILTINVKLQVKKIEELILKNIIF